MNSGSGGGGSSSGSGRRPSPGRDGSRPPNGGVWALDRHNKKLGRLLGSPLRVRPYALSSEVAFQVEEENPNPPKFILWEGPDWALDEEPVAIACSHEGAVAVLNWVDNGNANIHHLDPTQATVELTLREQARCRRGDVSVPVTRRAWRRFN